MLAERLRDRRCPVRLVLGGSDEAHVLEPLASRRSLGHVDVVIGDLSSAVHPALEDADVVYVAATESTQRMVAAAAADTDHTCQVALERALTCATGLCHGCPVPVLGDDGAPHVVRACVDGPVFRSGRVDWEALS
jgi:dihydroorotate dehydrogenase electron transfer subunit